MGYIFTPDTVDPEFAGRALEAFWLHKKPLLRGPLESDESVLYAIEQGGGYELIDPAVSLRDLSRLTWGEHYERCRSMYSTYEAYCEDEYGEYRDPDEAIDPQQVLECYIGPYDFPSGRAFVAIEPYFDAVGPRSGIRGHEVILGEGGGDFFEAVFREIHNPVPIEQRDTPYPLGFIIGHEGPMPGSDYVGIEVSGPVGLSCLQHVLDRAESGIRLELAPEGFDPWAM